MDKILMPKELTSENGAKALLIGEFYETLEIDLCMCTEMGTVDDAEEDCEFCNGTGVISHKVLVSWTTIKAIYQMIVEHFEDGPITVPRPSPEKEA